MTPPIRQFETGATRDTDQGKLDYEGFFSPRVFRKRAEYMHRHRVQADGNLRDSDNWQKGIPTEQYMKSLMRHVVEFWELHRADGSIDEKAEKLCAIMFNAEGYLYELLTHTQARDYSDRH